jgi:hypothetical protein
MEFLMERLAGRVREMGVRLVRQNAAPTRPVAASRKSAAIIYGAKCGPLTSRRYNVRAFFLIALLSSLMTGCKTSHPANTPTPPRIGSGAQEYQQLTVESKGSINTALGWLDRLAAQTNSCPPQLVADFSTEVDRLQAESMRVRARAQAILARGDAYFEAWSENPQAAAEQNQKAAEYLPQLKEFFGRIKSAGQQTRDAFRPFFSGLRKLRAQLQTDPGATQTVEGKDLIRTTRESGAQVVQRLGLLNDELQAVIPLLSRVKAAEKQ